MNVFFERKRFFSFLTICLLVIFFGAGFSGCALVEKWKKKPDPPERPHPPHNVFSNDPNNGSGPRVDVEPISRTSSTTLGQEPLAAQWEQQIAEIQKQSRQHTEQLNGEIARLQKELVAKEQKVQSLNASFSRQAVVAIPEKSKLKYTPVFSEEGITVLPRDGETLRIAVEDSYIFYPHAMQLLPTADTLLNTVVKEIRANYPENEIGIEAHADPSLDNPQNPMQIFETTTRKANTVANRLLEQKRINPKNLIIIGHGATKPLPRSEKIVNNNRIEFVVYP